MPGEGEEQILGKSSASEALNALSSFASPEFAEKIDEIHASKGEGQEQGQGKPDLPVIDIDTEGKKIIVEGQKPIEGQKPEGEGDDKGEGSDAKKGGDESDDDLSIDHEIFGGKKSLIKKKEEKPAAENLDQVNSHIKESLGFESMDELNSKVEEWKKLETTHVETTERLSNVEKLFEILPPELYQAVTAVANGKDWRTVLSETPSVDFRKEIDQYKDEEIVNAFYPGEISEDDWEEFNDEDGDPRIKKSIGILIKQAKEKFVTTKKDIETKSVNSVKEAQQTQERYDNSITGSVSKLSSQIEGVSETYIKNVEKELKNPASISKIFYNEDGTLTEGGALAYVMAKDGFGLLEKYKAVIQRKTETEVNQDILLRGANSPSGTRGTGSGEMKIRPEVQAELDKIRSLGGK
jgi:hypothetical protein